MNNHILSVYSILQRGMCNMSTPIPSFRLHTGCKAGGHGEATKHTRALCYGKWVVQGSVKPYRTVFSNNTNPSTIYSASSNMQLNARVTKQLSTDWAIALGNSPATISLQNINHPLFPFRSIVHIQVMAFSESKFGLNPTGLKRQ